ncbi:MAG: hypothetical protein CVV55_03070, partial [Synergistetes bacterium HGW-Synergistetes-2]
MYPVLFHIGDNPVHSYYLLWTLALTLAVVFSRRRMTYSYGIDDDDARSVIIWAFIGMLLGARAGSVYDETTGEGQLRHVVARTTAEGELMVTVVTKGQLKKKDDLLSFLENCDSVW